MIRHVRRAMDEETVHVADGNARERRGWEADTRVKRKGRSCGANSHVPRMRKETCAMEEAWKRRVGTKQGVRKINREGEDW